jgi:hypothetical protein
MGWINTDFLGELREWTRIFWNRSQQRIRPRMEGKQAELKTAEYAEYAETQGQTGFPSDSFLPSAYLAYFAVLNLLGLD